MNYQRRRTKRKKHRYRVPYTFNDEGRKLKLYVRVPKGCKFLKRIECNYGRLPKTIRGKEVVKWVNVYSADDAVADRFSPIVMLRNNYSRRKKKPKSLLTRLFHKLFR